MDTASIEIFINPSEESVEPTIALVLERPLIIEYGDDLCPAVSLSPAAARDLAHSLMDLADQIDELF